MKKEQITKILLKYNIVTPEQLNLVEEEIKKTGLSFFKAAEKTKVIGEKELNQLISEEIGVPKGQAASLKRARSSRPIREKVGLKIPTSQHPTGQQPSINYPQGK